MTLFIHCYSKGHEALQVTALHILCDMVTTHPTLLAPVTQPDGETVSPPPFQKPLLKVFARALKANSPNNVQSTAATALSKLLLTSAFSPSGPNVPPAIQELNQAAVETLLLSLVVTFYHPRTKENPGLRQSLAYFFPVYCHSRITNTYHMQRIAVPAVRAVLNAAEEHYSLEAEEDSDGEIDETVGQRELKTLMSGVVGMLAEWTDERRVVGLGGENVLTGGAASSSACGFVHLALVKEILERVLGISAGTPRCSKDEKKLLFSLMSKLYISPPPPPPSRSGSRNPEGSGDDPFRTSSRSANNGGEIAPANAQLAHDVKELLDQAIEEGVAGDAAGRNALVKVKNVMLKLLATAQGTRAPSDAKREGTEEGDSDMMSVRSGSVQSRAGSVRPSIEQGLMARRGVSVEPSIMEEDENEQEDSRGTIVSRGTVVKSEAD